MLLQLPFLQGKWHSRQTAGGRERRCSTSLTLRVCGRKLDVVEVKGCFWDANPKTGAWLLPPVLAVQGNGTARRPHRVRDVGCNVSIECGSICEQLPGVRTFFRSSGAARCADGRKRGRRVQEPYCDLLSCSRETSLLKTPELDVLSTLAGISRPACHNVRCSMLPKEHPTSARAYSSARTPRTRTSRSLRCW